MKLITALSIRVKLTGIRSQWFTNTVEGTNFALKRWVPVRYRTENDLGRRLFSFIWHRQHAENLWMSLLNTCHMFHMIKYTEWVISFYGGADNSSYFLKVRTTRPKIINKRTTRPNLLNFDYQSKFIKLRL